jgi:hypothetical protein
MSEDAVTACDPGPAPADHAWRTEYNYLLAMRDTKVPAFAMPSAYTDDALEVLSKLPMFLNVTILKVVSSGGLHSSCSNYLPMETIVRACIGRKILHPWAEYVQFCKGHVPSSEMPTRVPWEDGGALDFVTIVQQSSMIKQAAIAVGDNLASAWSVFVDALTKLPQCALAWIAPEQVCDALRGASPYYMYPNRAGKCLLYFFLDHMKVRDDDDIQDSTMAIMAANELNRKLVMLYPPPVHDFLTVDPKPASIDRLVGIVRDVFACSQTGLIELLLRNNLIDRMADVHSVIGTVNRMLAKLHMLPLTAQVPCKPSPQIVVANRVRTYILHTFTLAHGSAHGVSLKDIVSYHDKEHAKRRELATSASRLFFIKDMVLRALHIMFFKYDEYIGASNCWSELMAMYVAKLALGYRIRTAVSPFVLGIAKQMVVTRGDQQFISLVPVMRHLESCSTRPTPNRPLFMTCPAATAPRDSGWISEQFLLPSTTSWMLYTCTPAETNVMLDAMNVGEDVLEEDSVVGARLRVRSDAIRDVHVEMAWGMPSPRLLASRLNYFLNENADAPCETDVVSAALVWNMSMLVRHETALQELARSPPEVFTEKKRKRSRFEPVQCTACCAYVQPEASRGCNHYLCLACAVMVLEQRVVDVVVRDASTEEQTHGNICKCPQPDCDRNLLWAEPYMAPDTKYFLHKHMMTKEYKKEEAGKTPCAVCWGYVEADADAGVVGVCTVCDHSTCTVCGTLAHYGVVCPVITRGTNLAPETILNEAKTQACPNPECGVRTTKDGGCNHISCTKCTAHWCWVCAGMFDVGDVTAHYQTSATCSLHEYTESTETDRIRRSILERQDLPEETKQSVLRMLMTTFVQNEDDL